MRNILLVTELYPIPTKENNSSYVCHYFSREWARMGCDVKVIHFQPVHIRLWHLLIRYFGRLISNRLGGIYYSRRLSKVEMYEMDGVQVFRIPVFIPIPHGRFPKNSISYFARTVQRLLMAQKFVPDVITGHMLPLEVIPAINSFYNVKTCMVCHGISSKAVKRYPDISQLIDTYNIWGFRSKRIKQDFIREFGNPVKEFMCYSGVPEFFSCKSNKHSFDGHLHSFIYVGDLIDRKHPDSLLKAIPRRSNDDYSICFIGDGAEKENLMRLVDEYGIQNHVRFIGQVDRSSIVNYYDESDCFIMISHNEAFGLVYLEAMSRGCITIASRGEGIDGIITDGVNGFLCNAGDADELAKVLSFIDGLPQSEKKRISANAISTASEYTDRKTAENYLFHLNSICKN